MKRTEDKRGACGVPDDVVTPDAQEAIALIVVCVCGCVVAGVVLWLVLLG